ncbi:hypothetical protein FHR70_002562 [Microvirga lupini]|uniref:Uncharacterized protein n=1 Tax=Microvirga lupini TaxID=420324 RepID=A0A7W4VLQ1_9HYPH|nr:hypothetical protein [Microvirga lupini]MBB3019497.1 hypothetical protein [Microvirga lupini]
MQQTFRDDIASELTFPRRRSSHPFTHPHQVLGHALLSRGEKPALLAQWASDACSVEGRPGWRQIPGSGAVVVIDDILDALRALDYRHS